MNLTDVITIFTYVCTACSLILKGLEIIAPHTPTKVDDRVVEEGNKIVSFLLKLLNALALNTKGGKK